MSKRGLEVDIDKVKSILALATPSYVQEIWGFFGCVRHYQRFIDGYTRKAVPLTELLKKDVEFTWNPDRQRAFEELKSALTKAPILSPPDWEKESM